MITSVKNTNRHELKLYSFILQSMRPFRWYVVGILLVACFFSVHASLQPVAIKLILDSLSTDPSGGHTIIPVLFYGLLSLISIITFRFYDYICLRFYPCLKANIIKYSVIVISQYSYSFYQDHLSGSLMNKIKDLSIATADFIQIFVDRLFSNFLALAIACFTLGIIHPVLPFILIIWTALLIYVSWHASKRLRPLSLKLSEVTSEMTGALIDRFINILNIKLFVSYKYEQNRLKSDLQDVINSDQSLRWYLLKVIAIQGLVALIMILCCLTTLIFALKYRNISIGDFGLVLTLTISLADIIWKFAKEISHFSSIYGLIIQGLKLLSEESIIKRNGAKDIFITKGEIMFLNVSFQYPQRSPIFIDKTVKIYPGQKVGLVGYSGSGKSTFVGLILRLFEVTSGKILIDDQDMSKVNITSLHHSITMIPQEPILFHRSLMENIRYGKLDATDREVYEAAVQANAHEFIMSFPEKYNSIVGERGIKLSGGQRQRVAIARAMLKNSSILLLDEATSALDSVTESLVKKALFKLTEGKTTIVIAHRLSTLQQLDRILVFDYGKIVEDGNHYELLKKNGVYKKLWDIHAGGFVSRSEFEADIGANELVM